MRSAIPGLLLVAALPAAAPAQDTPPPRTIQVTGNGKVSTMPAIALIEYNVSGEGRTADEASTALAARQKAVSDGVRGLLGGHTVLTTSNVTLVEVRSPECGGGGYNAQPRLSQGACAVIGYLASSQASVRTDTILKAGTAVGLAARLGASAARIQNFVLADDAETQRRATDDAVADAQRRAQAIAAAAGAKLGAVMTIRDQNNNYGEVIVSGSRVSAPPAPPPPSAPVAIDVAPRPIDTRAQIYVTYALLP